MAVRVFNSCKLTRSNPDTWQFSGTQESRDASGARPDLANEALTLNHEFGSVTTYSRSGFNSFAEALFFRKLPNGDIEDVWGNALNAAPLICARSDVQTLIAELGTAKEEAMYPALVALSEIVILYDAQTHHNPANPTLPPDPFVHQVFRRKVGSTWPKTDAAHAYVPPHGPSFRLVDTHHSPLGGLHVNEKYVFRRHLVQSFSHSSLLFLKARPHRRSRRQCNPR